MKKYRKKPIVIDAIQFDGSKESALAILKHSTPLSQMEIVYTSLKEHPVTIEIKTLEGTVKALRGDYVIRGVQGEFYPCKPDIFKDTYEEVKEFRAE